jgi:hypothetical protein
MYLAYMRARGYTQKLLVRSTWECNIKINLKELGWEGVDWTEMAQDRKQCRHIFNMILNLTFP